MNGLRRDGLDRARALSILAGPAPELATEVVICPPAPLLAEIRGALDGSAVALGAQDCSALDPGAHTGDIAAAMLADVGCSYVIVGHSERRAGHGEDDGLVRAKAQAAHAAGLSAIMCVGESAEERDAGRALDVVGGQLDGSLPDGASAANTVVAYEPVWAIGTGRTPNTDEVAQMQGAMRERIGARVGEAGAGMRLLYGGSVKASNAAGLLAVTHVDGALVGGASLSVDDFWAICLAAAAAAA
jgi:triosephosphate isomerase